MNSARPSLELVPQARAELNRRRLESSCEHIFAVLDAVKDPEIPVLSIWELGILQNVELLELPNQTQVVVTLTPTYSGCPAMAQLEADVRAVLRDAGYWGVEIHIQLAPAWTSDWLTPQARARLRGFGIAPPQSTNCPQCASKDTSLVSEFGSTSCKALYRCNACGEPFDQFKSI